MFFEPVLCLRKVTLVIIVHQLKTNKWKRVIDECLTVRLGRWALRSSSHGGSDWRWGACCFWREKLLNSLPSQQLDHLCIQFVQLNTWTHTHTQKTGRQILLAPPRGQSSPSNCPGRWRLPPSSLSPSFMLLERLAFVQDSKDSISPAPTFTSVTEKYIHSATVFLYCLQVFQ